MFIKKKQRAAVAARCEQTISWTEDVSKDVLTVQVSSQTFTCLQPLTHGEDNTEKEPADWKHPLVT